MLVNLENIRSALTGAIRNALRQDLPSCMVLAFSFFGSTVLVVNFGEGVKQGLFGLLMMMGMNETATFAFTAQQKSRT